MQIELELSNGYRDLTRDGFDLAIRSDAAIDERLVARPAGVARDDLRQPGLSRSVRRTTNPQALAEHRCLLNSHYSGREEWLYHQQHELLRVRVSGPFASNHYSLLKKPPWRVPESLGYRPTC
ncbi:hypothetical protein QZH47_14920 [Pseudomonas corrugata]